MIYIVSDEKIEIMEQMLKTQKEMLITLGELYISLKLRVEMLEQKWEMS